MCFEHSNMIGQCLAKLLTRQGVTLGKGGGAGGGVKTPFLAGDENDSIYETKSSNFDLLIPRYGIFADKVNNLKYIAIKKYERYGQHFFIFAYIPL